MFKRILIIPVIFLSLASLNAQDNLPLYSAVQYEVQADSLFRSNEPQDLIVSISSSSSQGLESYELKIYDLKVLWTLVSATFNNEPIWLVKADSKSDNEKVLSWNYDREQSLLRLYPPDWQSGYELEVTVRLSILEPGLVKKTDAKNLSLEAEFGGTKYQCSPRGSGSDMTFKKKLRKTR